MKNRWTFKVPTSESDYGLLVYAGISGKTDNIGVNYHGIDVIDLQET